MAQAPAAPKDAGIQNRDFQNSDFENWMDTEHPNWRDYKKTTTGAENNIVARMRAAWHGAHDCYVQRMDEMQQKMAAATKAEGWHP